MKTLTTKTHRSLSASLIFFVLLTFSCGVLDQNELQLINAIKQIRAMKIDQAIDTLHALLINKPHFKLAQLIYADLLESRAQAINHVGQPFNPNQEELTELLEEAQVRWKHFS